ncbi:MAG: ABC transporter ATP-binding protein [Parvibaculum sp.]
MALEFSQLTHRFDVSPVLRDVSLVAEKGEILCLLGASGSGKTTLLRLAAGLERLQAGTITLDGQVLADTKHTVPAEARQIGMVFQDHALFPHLSVAQNVAFGLEKSGAGGRSAIVRQVLADVGLAGYEDRFPHTLSGGQQQRVALARALAPRPSVILLDEPFASIDVTRRRALRENARLTLKQTGAITVMVTHDPDEAMDMADKIAVMEGGRILQHGKPVDLYCHPQSALVARLFGDAQVFEAHIKQGQAMFAYGSVPTSAVAEGSRAELVVRPSTIRLTASTSPADPVVIDIRFRGNHWLVLVEHADPQTPPLRAHLASANDLVLGQSVSVSFEGAEHFLYPATD